MKVTLVFCALLGLSCALPAAHYGLKDDLDDFLALIPTDKIEAIVKAHLKDPEVQEIIAYLRGPEFAKVVEICVNVPEVQKVVKFIDSKDIPATDLLNKVLHMLGLPPISDSFHEAARSFRSVHDVVEQIISLLPLDEMVALGLDKLANSEDFGALFDMIASVDGQRLHDQAMSHPEIRNLIKKINELGFDTEKIWEAVKGVMGWGYSSYASTGLRKDLEDFLALIPKDKVLALVKKYENDPEVQKIIAYLHSNDFAKVIHIIAHVPEVQDVVNYLEINGLHVVELLNKLADRLGLPHWPDTYHAAGRATRSVRQFLDELKALIPKEQVIALALDKLANDTAFGALFEKIASIDGQRLLDQAKTHPEIVDALNRLRALGVDLDKIWEVVKSIFGW